MLTQSRSLIESSSSASVTGKRTYNKSTEPASTNTTTTIKKMTNFIKKMSGTNTKVVHKRFVNLTQDSDNRKYGFNTKDYYDNKSNDNSHYGNSFDFFDTHNNIDELDYNHNDTEVKVCVLLINDL
ncbi:7450_t:CDS:2 [Funneliformis caledonium]|uniref:7450_t:CDS:1 n=1 Tax=Funneliformis caledonium TaxID=1117310 RepID=A0A9N9DKA0_9GLOM|nr:7450_t:CDS:2 [Funneliformis caledonium]